MLMTYSLQLPEPSHSVSHSGRVKAKYNIRNSKYERGSQ